VVCNGTNPFEIIPLQTARKENNWKTEEALARAAVTGDGMDQRAQSLVFMMMMMISFPYRVTRYKLFVQKASVKKFLSVTEWISGGCLLAIIFGCAKVKGC